MLRHFTIRMPSKSVIEILKRIFKFGNMFHSLIPIRVVSNLLVVNRHSKSKRTRFWIIHWYLSILLTVCQLNTHLNALENTKLFFTVFHGFLLILEFGGLAALLMFHHETLELCQFLNQLFLNPNGLISFRFSKTKVARNGFAGRYLLAVFLVSLYTCGLVIIWLLIPLIMHTFPVLMEVILSFFWAANLGNHPIASTFIFILSIWNNWFNNWCRGVHSFDGN